MSVIDPDVIDAIGTDRTTGEVILTISDHLEWGPSHAEHAGALERKLGRYLDFIGSGQLLQDYPKAYERRVIVEVVQKHRPDANATAWLEAARREYEIKGQSLRWRVLQEE